MKEQYIAIIFLLLGPILDVTSFLGLPFSIIFRGLFLVYIIFAIVKNKKEIKYLVPLLLFGIFYLVYQIYGLHFNVSSSLSSVLKFLYLPISILYFKNYVFPMEKSKVLSIILVTYIGIYLLSYILGIGADAYLETDGKSGFKGLFSSINEFSAILVCLLPVVTTYLKKEKKYLFLVGLIISAFLCSLLIGTKVLMFGVIFTIFYLLWQERKKLFLEQKKSIKIGIIVSFVIIVIIGGFLFTKTRTFQNMLVQQDFFKVENVISLEFVNKIIYNDRLTFLKDNFNYWKNQSVSKMIFGFGLENYDIKMIEIDEFDLLIRYGIIGLILFVGSIVLSVDKKNLKPEEKISILLLIVISLTSGHVLFYPTVCIYFAVMLAKDNTKKAINVKKKRFS